MVEFPQECRSPQAGAGSKSGSGESRLRQSCEGEGKPSRNWVWKARTANKTDHDEVFKEVRRFGNEAIAALEKDGSESADIIKKSIRATLRFAKENLENDTIKGARTHMRTTIKICAHTGWAVDFYYDILKSPRGDDETRMDFYKKIDEPGMADWHLERLLEKGRVTDLRK